MTIVTIMMIMTLLLTDPPLVTGSGVQHASPGWVVSVWCRVLADPSPSLAWYRDDTGNILTTQLQPTERVSRLLYCAVLYSTVLYCDVLYYIVLYCTVLYYPVLFAKKIFI